MELVSVMLAVVTSGCIGFAWGVWITNAAFEEQEKRKAKKDV